MSEATLRTQRSGPPGFFIVTFLALCFAGPAAPMEADERGLFSQIEANLAQEHQVEIASAKYALNPNDPARIKILRLKFTANANGDAYVLMSDGVDDAHAKTELVYARLKNARVYDPRKVGVMPPGVAATSSLGDLIQRAATTGDGLMLYGQLAKRQADGTDLVAGSLAILANISGSRDERVADRVVIFVVALNGAASLDKVVGFDVLYRFHR